MKQLLSLSGVSLSMKSSPWIFIALLALASPVQSEDLKIDFARARQLFQREQSGGALTPEEKSYLDEAKRQRNAQGRTNDRRPELPKDTPVSAAAKGLVPLTELSGDYRGRDGGCTVAGRMKSR